MTSTNFDPRILKAPHPVPGAPDNWKRFFSFNTDAKGDWHSIHRHLVAFPACGRAPGHGDAG